MSHATAESRVVTLRLPPRVQRGLCDSPYVCSGTHRLWRGDRGVPLRGEEPGKVAADTQGPTGRRLSGWHSKEGSLS